MTCLPSGIAGGLTNLAKMPACNLMLLGAQRRTLAGFSSTSLLPHTGYIYHCDVVQSLPPVSARPLLLQLSVLIQVRRSLTNCVSLCTCFKDLRRKAARLVASKCTLAARVDSFHESAVGKVRRVCCVMSRCTA